MSAATINPDKELEKATETAEECDRIVEAQRASMRAREEAQRAKEALGVRVADAKKKTKK